MITVFPEVFAWALFSCNFTVGVGSWKLNLQNFCTSENLESAKKNTATCMCCDFVDMVQLLFLPSFSSSRLISVSMRRLVEQGVVTPIGPILTTATAVKTFDRPNSTLTLWLCWFYSLDPLTEQSLHLQTCMEFRRVWAILNKSWTIKHAPVYTTQSFALT